MHMVCWATVVEEAVGAAVRAECHKKLKFATRLVAGSATTPAAAVVDSLRSAPYRIGTSNESKEENRARHDQATQ